MYKIICVLVMILVTYLPRAIPIVFIKKEIKNEFFKSFLFYVPYAVLASLTFPAIFYFSSNIYLGIIGTVTALILAFFNQKLYVVALVSVVVVFGFSFIFF